MLDLPVIGPVTHFWTMGSNLIGERQYVVWP